MGYTISTLSLLLPYSASYLKDKLKADGLITHLGSNSLLIMIIHPSFFLFIISILFSIVTVISSNSWFLAWLGIEINLLSFLPLILKKKNKLRSESRLKYFLVQALASVLIIFCIIRIFILNKISLFLILRSLFLKIGAAPFHQWVPRLVEGLSWPCLFLLFTFQKINPIVLRITLLDKWERYVYFIVVMSCLVGRVGGLLHSSLRKILAYSSIRQLSWIVCGAWLSKFVWFSYFFLYIIILLSVFNIFSYNNFFFLNQILIRVGGVISLLRRCSLLSLGGLPPFAGFLPKYLMSLELIQRENLYLLLFLLFGTFFSLFFYTRVLLVNILINFGSNIIYFEKEKSRYLINSLNLFFLLTPGIFFVFLLNFKLYKLKTFKVLKEVSLSLMRFKLSKLKAFQAIKKKILNLKLLIDGFFLQTIKTLGHYILF